MMILDTLVLLFILTVVIGPVVIWASWNEINSNEWIANNVDGCPFKYKWQIADDLAMYRKDIRFSYLMTLPKAEVKKVWMINDKQNKRQGEQQ